MNIPQITREKIASSVVGTPGVDTSGQQLGQEIAEGAQKIVAPAWQYLEQDRANKDTAEYNSLIGQHRMNLLKAEEDIKITYANNPDKATEVIMDFDAKGVEAISQRASNPRVKLMVAKGAPDATLTTYKNIASWSAKQKHDNLVSSAESMMNDASGMILKIAEDPTLSAQDKMQSLNPFIKAGVNKAEEFRAIGDPAMADEVAYKTGQSALTSLIVPLIESQPYQAKELLDNPETAKFFGGKDVKALEEYKKNADKAIVELPTKILKENIKNDLVKNTQLSQEVFNGKITFRDIAAAQQKDTYGLHPETYKHLADISLGVGGQVEAGVRDSMKAAILADASALGFKASNDPTQLTGKGAKEKAMAVVASNTVKDLYKLQDKILNAVTMGVLTPEEGKKYHDWIYVPLVNKVMQKTDPSFFDKLVSQSGAGIGGGLVSAGVGIFNKMFPKKVDEFQTVSGIVKEYLTRTDKAKDFVSQTNFYEAYFKAADEKLKPTSINPRTQAPYTPADLAHAVVGEGVGDAIETPLGRKIITGHNKKTGAPEYEVTQEDLDYISHQKELQKIQKGKR